MVVGARINALLQTGCSKRRTSVARQLRAVQAQISSDLSSWAHGSVWQWNRGGCSSGCGCGGSWSCSCRSAITSCALVIIYSWAVHQARTHVTAIAEIFTSSIISSWMDAFGFLTNTYLFCRGGYQLFRFRRPPRWIVGDATMGNKAHSFCWNLYVADWHWGVCLQESMHCASLTPELRWNGVAHSKILSQKRKKHPSGVAKCAMF